MLHERKSVPLLFDILKLVLKPERLKGRSTVLCSPKKLPPVRSRITNHALRSLCDVVLQLLRYQRKPKVKLKIVVKKAHFWPTFFDAAPNTVGQRQQFA